MSTPYYGPITGSGIAHSLKEGIRRVIEFANQDPRLLEAHQKLGYGGKLDDFATNLDIGAQEIFVKLIREDFPLFGIIAEEGGLYIPSRHADHDIYVVCDGIDGTKALIRRQSDGIGTMVAVVCDGVIIAVYVGDIRTKEIYGYRPESDKVHRIHGYNKSEELAINPSLLLHEQYVQLRDDQSIHSQLIQDLVRRGSGPFKSIEIRGGSIGIMMARLWKGEIGAVVLRPEVRTPWDETPIVGISQKMGFVFLRLEDGVFVQDELRPIKTVQPSEAKELLVIHRSRLGELNEWMQTR